jgi:hypothetical protein
MIIVFLSSNKIYLKNTAMNILQLNPQIVVYTPLGTGLAYFIMDYGMSVNSCWVVRLAKGEIKHFDSNDVRVEGNPTYGFPLKPEIPDSWMTFKEKDKLIKGN